MRNSTQKICKKNFDSGKAFEGNVSLNEFNSALRQEINRFNYYFSFNPKYFALHQTK